MKIKSCRFCKSLNLVPILQLGNHYLSHFINPDEDRGKTYPLNTVLCTNCTLLQLDYSVPSNLLYADDYGYKSGISETIRADLKDIAHETAMRINLQPGDIWVDIGANDGTLLKNCSKDIIRVGIDPIAKFGEYYNEENLHFINDYFSFDIFNKHFLNKKTKAITIISCFYDFEEPNKLLKDLVKILDKDGIITIQQNYLVGMLLQNAFDNIVAEHLLYCSLTALDSLLKRHNLMVFDVLLNDINGGSFRTYICRDDERQVQDSVLTLKEKEKELGLNKKEIYEQFGQRIKNIAGTIHDFVEGEVKKGKTVMTLAASTRGNTLLQYCGLDNTLIKGATERNPEKLGKIMASTKIPIISEEQMRKEKPDYLFVLPWFFFSPQIREREEDYLQEGGTFLVPLPTPKLITKEGEVDL